MRIRSKTLIFLTLLLIGLSSCKKSETAAYKCATCATSPTAAAANDNSGKGIYKGTIAGSTGTVLIDIENSSNSISAVIIIDGQTINLSSTSAYTAGQPYTGVFTGSYSGQAASITFVVDANGGSPTVTAINIAGHPNATIVVFKELSTSQVVCYEGTFGGTSSGVFNMIINTQANTWMTIAKDNNHSTATLVSGTVSGTSVSCTSCIGGAGTVSGTISGDNINGSWNDGQGGSGTWACHKTL
ncbi:MAG: hypothetical protein JWO03_4050 [Bacteroidetes bacterium]|nr:hypothetical protein [Bacteroidota bacterium]